jgi:hypothetical protein
MKVSLDSFLEKINSHKYHQYDDPRNFNFSHKTIDIKLRNLLTKINKSDWCWTLYSCQGHKYKDGAKTLPYFVFIVRNEKKNMFLDLLLKTIDNDVDPVFPVHNPYSFEMSSGFSDENFSIITVWWSMAFLKKRGKLNELHDRFEVLADSILELNNG